MAAGLTIKHKRKAGAFSNGELAAGELGLDTTNSVLYYSANGTTVVSLGSLYQPLNSVLTAFAAVTQTNDNFLQVKSGAWAGRTIAQVKSDLGLTGTNSGDQTTITGNAGTATALQTARTIGGVSFNGTANITVSTATGGFTVSGGNLALGANSLTLTGSIGATGARATKLWAADGEFTNLPTVGGAALKTALALNNVDNTSNATERAAAATLTNKRVTPRVLAHGSSATPTINTDSYDFVDITALATNITSMTSGLSGTPTNGQKLWIAITGTGARTISWGSSFEAGAVALPTTTVSTTRLDTAFIWNSASNKWRAMASG